MHRRFPVVNSFTKYYFVNRKIPHDLPASKNQTSEANMPEILNRHEAAEFLMLPLRTIAYLVTSGQLPHSRVSRRRVVFLNE
jgi:hypothetical protein